MQVHEVLTNPFGVVRVRLTAPPAMHTTAVVAHARKAAAAALRSPVEFLYAVKPSDTASHDLLVSGPRPRP
jgi:hypothetical protein